MASSSDLQLEDIPADDAPWQEINEFAHTFDGYAYFGDDWGECLNAVRERHQANGELPDDIDDLRAILFLEFRADRFCWGDDVILSEPDAEGVRDILNNPDFEDSPTACDRRAMVRRLRELVSRAA